MPGGAVRERAVSWWAIVVAGVILGACASVLSGDVASAASPGGASMRAHAAWAVVTGQGVWVSGGFKPVGTSVTPAAQPTVPLPPPGPPTLAEMEWEMSNLSVQTERFAVRVKTSGFPPADAKDIDVSVTGVADSIDTTARLSTRIYGRDTDLRFVSGRYYLHEPGVGARDRGRPWVEVDPSHVAAALRVPHDSVGVTELESTGIGVTMKGVADLIAGATGMLPGAAQVVDGQSCTPYSGAIDPSKLEKGVTYPTALSTTGSLMVCFAANGLPVRTQLSLGFGPFGMTIDFDLYAINVPVQVQAPARSRTITLKRLHALERGTRARRAAGLLRTARRQEAARAMSGAP